MDERRLEAKVGALLLAAVVGTIGLLWLMGELSLGPSAGLKVQFGHTGNVVEGAPVKLGGVPIGRVDEIVLSVDQRDDQGVPLPVTMRLAVEPKVRAALREDAAITVATAGPLGEPYLEVYLGSQSAPPFPADKIIRGLDAPRLDLVANRLSAFLESASRILEDDPRALSTLVGGVSSLTRTVDGVLTDNRDQLRILAADLAAAAKDLRALSQLARSNLEPGGKGARLIDDAAESAKVIRADLPQLSATAGKAIGGLAALSGTFTAEDGERLKSAIGHYGAAGQKLDSIATRGDRILARMESGQGTAGALYKDPALYDDLKQLVSELKKHPWKMLWKD